MIVRRSEENPILKPLREHSWEAEAAFNGCPVKKGKETYLLYRALSHSHYHTSARTEMMVSDIGIAKSVDGVHFADRKRFIVPEYSWERFGCEDPRVTKLGDTYYVFYTALGAYPFRAEGIKVGVALSKDLRTVSEKHLVTPFNAKGMAMFPEKIGGKIWTLLTLHTDMPPAHICLASFDNESDLWSRPHWEAWYKTYKSHVLPLVRRPEDHVEVGAPPVKTKDGWLVIYSYIRNYFSPVKQFGIEAVLLDLENPLKVVARTDMPILVPEEYYERIGLVPNIVFPTGALIEKGWVKLYYGAADMTCCLALIELDSLLRSMTQKERGVATLMRAKENPILVPVAGHAWETKATFNPGAIHAGGKFHIVYRAMSDDNTSVFGYASSMDGVHVDERLPEPIYVPRDAFEQKLVPGGNSGCEDPRLTLVGDRIYMLYAAYDGQHPPRVAITSIKEADFLNKEWNWAPSALISPPDISDKDAFVFPERVLGKWMIVHRIGDSIDFAFLKSLDFKGEEWIEEHRWIAPRKGSWDSKKVGTATPPVKTADGWVMLYHGISDDGTYRVGAVLLDLADPTRVIGRLDAPLFEPVMPYEVNGQVSRVVFPCGAVLSGKTLLVYYGGGDSVVGVATIPIAKLLTALKFCTC